MRAICLYLHIHQPIRYREYSIFDVGNTANYFHDSNISASPVLEGWEGGLFYLQISFLRQPLKVFRESAWTHTGEIILLASSPGLGPSQPGAALPASRFRTLQKSGGNASRGLVPSSD